MNLDPRRTIAELKELRALTGAVRARDLTGRILKDGTAALREAEAQPFDDTRRRRRREDGRDGEVPAARIARTSSQVAYPSAPANAEITKNIAVKPYCRSTGRAHR